MSRRLLLLGAEAGAAGAGKLGSGFVAEQDLAHSERISEVVIASGDNYFVDTVRKFTDHHIPVTVIAHSRGLSHELRLVAPTLVLLRQGFGAWRFAS